MAVWLAVIVVAAGAAAGGLYGRLRGAPVPVARSPGAAPAGPVSSWRWVWAGAAGLLLIGLGSRWVPGSAGVAVEIGGYAATAAFAAANGRRPGMILVAAGLLANLAVISVDGGMPVRSLPAGSVGAAHHHGLSSADHLPFLADDLTLPRLSEQASAGDLLITLGAAVVTFGWVEPFGRPRRSRSSPVAGPAAGLQ